MFGAAPAAPGGQPVGLSDAEMFGDAPTPPVESSTGGAFGRAAVRGALPAAGGMAGFGAGMVAAQPVLAPLAAMTGPAAPAVEGIGSFLAGLAGAYGGGALVRSGQDKIVRMLPEGVQRFLGQDAPQVQADTTQHPYATMAGDIAPNLLFMRPGFGARVAAPEGAPLAQRIFSHPVGAPAAGAGLGAAQEAVAEQVQEGKIDPKKVAIAAAGGALMSHETKLGAKVANAFPGVFQSWRAGRTGGVSDAGGTPPPPDTPPTPQEVEEFAASPEAAAFMRANGINHPDDPRIPQLLDRLAVRRPAEAASQRVPPQAQPEPAQVQAEREGIENGDIHPGFDSQAGRAPRAALPDQIPVTPAGQADTGDLGVRAGIDKFAAAAAGLPVVTEPQPTRMSEADIARSRAKMAGGTQNAAEPPPRLVTPQDRLPQTPEQVQGQRQAGEAFTAADAQRGRAGTVDTVDTQPAGRPEGVDATNVTLDDGFPVRVLKRTVKEVGGKHIDMAQVHRYDPRTGELDPEAVPYEVPARQLKTAAYAVDPRQAQDFHQRAQGPGNPEAERMPNEPVRRQQDQTYRATPEDNNADFPGATRPGPGDGEGPQGRSPLPEQPEGPHPGRQRPRSEEEAIRDFQARARDREGADYRSRRAEGARKEDAKASSIAAGLDAEGRFPVDDRGYVASDKGGPVRFADQKQAAKWIINEGHKKSADQIFEIENHPGGKGFTVHERGRAETTPPEHPSPNGFSPVAVKGGARAAEGGASPGASSPRAAPRRNSGTRGTLLDAIRAHGGIRDDRGDVAQIMRDYKNPRFKRKVVNPEGLPPDKMRERLQEEGWFGRHDDSGVAQETGAHGGDDVRDLYDLMDREARGDAVYHPDEAPTDREMTREAERIQDEEMNRAGVTENDTPQEIERKLADFRASETARFEEEAAKAKVIDEAVESLDSTDRENVDVEDYEPGADYGAEEETPGAGKKKPGGYESRARQSDDIPGWEDNAGGSHRETGGADRSNREGAEPAARSEGLDQTEVPGTAEVTREEMRARQARRDAEERQQNPRTYSGKAQKDHAEDGLFADQSEKAQSDMFGGTAEEKSAASTLRDKFFSNPAGDPEAWRELGRTLAHAFGWVKEEAQAWARHLESMTASFPKLEMGGANKLDRAWKATYPMRRWLEIASYSNDGRLRSMSSRFKSPVAREIADMFFAAPRGGREGAVGKDYFQAISERRGRWLNQIEDAFGPLEKMTDKQKGEALNQIGRLVQNPGAIKRGTPIHDAAAEIGRILKEALAYQRAAGVDIGEVKRGYLPRVENTDAIMANPEKFKAAAVKAYVSDGVPLKEAKAASEEWLQRVLLGDLGVHHDGNDFFDRGGSNTSATKSRVLSKKADDIMGDFFLHNPAEILPAYIGRAVQRAEWSRRFGLRDKGARPPRGVDAAEWAADPDGKWKDLKQRLIDEGNGKLVPDIVRIIKSMTGNMGGKWAISGSGRGAINFARTWSALTYLPRAVFASLSEPMNIALRTGNTLDAGRAYVHTLQHWLPIVRKAAGPTYLRELAHDLGFIGEAIDNLTMLQRVGSEETGNFSRKIQSQFFKRTGLTQLTEANRMAAVQIGQTFIRRLASDVANKSHYDTIARRMLAELGVTKADDFAKFVMALDKPKAADILQGGELGDAYHTALGRFVSQTVMAPSGAVRSYFAQHPLGGLIYNLQSFNYAFQKNVLNRIGAMTKDAVNPKSGLNAHERAYALMPLLNVVPLLMVTYGIGEIRDALFQDPARAGQPPMDFAAKAKRAVSRAGITGAMDMPYNAVTGARYQRDPLTALLGPIVGGGDTLVGDALNANSDRNSPNTNTFERKAMKDVYSMIVQPTLEAGALVAAPETTALGFGLGTVGMYGLSHPAARETFVRSLYGPPETP